MRENLHKKIKLFNDSTIEFIISLARIGMKNLFEELEEEYKINNNRDIEDWVKEVLNSLSTSQKEILEFYFNDDGYFGVGLAFFAEEYMENNDVLSVDDDTHKSRIMDFISFLKEIPAERYSIYLLQPICNRELNKEILDELKNSKNAFDLFEEMFPLSSKGKWQAYKILSKPEVVKNELIVLLDYIYHNLYYKIEKDITSLVNEYINTNENNFKNAFLDSIYDAFSEDYLLSLIEYSDSLDVMVSYFLDFGSMTSLGKERFLIGYRYPELVDRETGGNEIFDRQLSIYKALADQTRLKILIEIKKSSKYLTEIAEIMGISNPAVKYHLKKLLNVGLIEVDKSENRIYYKLNKKKFKEFTSQVEETFL